MSRSSLTILAVAALMLAGCEAQPLNTTETQAPAEQPSAPQPEAQQPAPSPAQQPAPAQNPQPAPSQRQQAAQPRQTSAPVPAPKPKPEPARVSVAAGTILDVKLAQDLNSGTNQTGDAFSATVETPFTVDGGTVIPVGSIIRGTLQDVKAAKKGAGHATMTLRFEELELPSGYSAPITASLSEETAGKGKRNAAIIGGSAAGGALLGKVLGDDTKHAAIGAVVGGAIATGIVLTREGDQVEIPAGSTFSIQLEEAIQVPPAPPAS